MNRETVVFLIVVIIGVGLTVYIRSSNNNESQQEKNTLTEIQARKSSHNKIKQEIKDFALKHNAIIGWKKDLDRKRAILNLYTLEVEGVLLQKDNQPILFIASVDDIIKEEDRYIVYFNDKMSFRPKIYFILQCSSKQVDEILSHSKSVYGNFAVVANISQVRKFRFQLQANSAIGHEDVDIEFSPSNEFMAKGSCIDFIYVDKYYSRDFLKELD